MLCIYILLQSLQASLDCAFNLSKFNYTCLAQKGERGKHKLSWVSDFACHSLQWACTPEWIWDGTGESAVPSASSRDEGFVLYLIALKVTVYLKLPTMWVDMALQVSQLVQLMFYGESACLPSLEIEGGLLRDECQPGLHFMDDVKAFSRIIVIICNFHLTVEYFKLSIL